MVNRNELDVIGILRIAPTEQVGSVPVCIHEANIKNRNLMKLIHADLRRAQVIHGVLRIDKFLAATNFLGWLFAT